MGDVIDSADRQVVDTVARIALHTSVAAGKLPPEVAFPVEMPEALRFEYEDSVTYSTRKALGFQADAFMASDQGWRFLEAMRGLIARAYKDGVRDVEKVRADASWAQSQAMQAAILSGILQGCLPEDERENPEGFDDE